MKVLKFGAVWCSACHVMRPRWEKIEKANPWLQTEYYDYDQEEKMITKYKVGDNIPEFIFLDKKGEEFLRLNGEISEKKLLEIIQKYKDQ
jgi:thiol-disulfide isomerase/thioredoxin